MSNLYNYCTKCGHELTEREVNVASKIKLPMCMTCIHATLGKKLKQVGERMAEQAIQSLEEAFRPSNDDDMTVIPVETEESDG